MLRQEINSNNKHELTYQGKRMELKEVVLSTPELTRKVFLPVISNSFGKNTVNCIHFKLIPVKNSAAKYL